MPATWDFCVRKPGISPYSAFRIATPAWNASCPVSGIEPWAALPCTVTSNCRQPLCAVTIWYEKLAPIT